MGSFRLYQDRLTGLERHDLGGVVVRHLDGLVESFLPLPFAGFGLNESSREARKEIGRN
jgi:hypothetical protein